MDLDIEMDVDVDDAPYVAQIPEAYTQDIITGEEQEPGEVDEDPTNSGGDDAHADKIVTPHKVHIRGLDTFTPDDVKAYLAQHYSAGSFDRIEWIDDSSANIVFKSESMAQEALVALAAVAIADATQLPPLETVPARDYAAKPDSRLQVRFAVTGDRKVVGAAQRSRFYLLHPEYDPEERRRRGDFTRGKYRDRDEGYRRDGRGRGDKRDGRDGRRRDHRDEEDDEPFDVNLYGDDPVVLAQRTLGRRPRSRRRSASSGSLESDHSRSYSQRNREKELFPSRRSGNGYRARARSASPVRDRDGDAQMDEDESARVAAALRTREKGRSIQERLTKDNSTREPREPRELFPTKENRVKELFPTKISSVAGSKAQMDQVDDTTVLASAKLADRITPRSAAVVSSGLNIRGLATKRANEQGLTIKGTGATAKELFPDKFGGGNSGKELFADRLEGRGRRRQKAEDSFY
ncbi:hypothetical protein B0T25DRAFT_472933 [Lasiosphaeria hispida]|uniref:Uncharacterized protein n=1 Tax=Lasiosphaeria hispida TaxID=260671 RepID=A0AAJ0MI94_9PEZI|nr:hypothetical protein B0T25DRAFT_472933 [Lasiosphaeria hispida]